MSVTPRARAKAKSDGETAGALQTAMGAIFQRLGPLLAASSADGAVQWHEIGSNAMLQYAGLLAQPVSCSLKAPAKAPSK